MAGMAKTAREGSAQAAAKGAKKAPREARQRARALTDEIRRHERLYFVEARPEITDAAFDALMRELVAIEEEYPELAAPDSPSRRVGGTPAEGFAAVAHAIPILSLENAYSWEEAEAWLARAGACSGPSRRPF
jgi:DNA ligase (NAD+)